MRPYPSTINVNWNGRHGETTRPATLESHPPPRAMQHPDAAARGADGAGMDVDVGLRSLSGEHNVTPDTVPDPAAAALSTSAPRLRRIPSDQPLAGLGKSAVERRLPARLRPDQAWRHARAFNGTVQRRLGQGMRLTMAWEIWAAWRVGWTLTIATAPATGARRRAGLHPDGDRPPAFPRLPGISHHRHRQRGEWQTT